MKSIQLHRFARARLWVDEPATPGFAREGERSRSVRAGPASPGQCRAISVEAMRQGDPGAYGLLGVRFKPSGRSDLTVEVPCTIADGVRWPDALAIGIDDVRLGLAEEYVPGVLDSLASSAAGRLPPGRLLMTEAAHGLIGSSSRLFGRLAGVVVALLLADGGDVSEQRAGELLRVALFE